MLEEVRACFKDQRVDEVGRAVWMAMTSSGYVVGSLRFVGLEQSLIFVLGKRRQAGQRDLLRGGQYSFRWYGLLY